MTTTASSASTSPGTSTGTQTHPWSAAVQDEIAQAEQTPWLTGKTAVVAGGGLSGPEGGVGFAMAWLFSRAGARIAVLDRDQEAAQRTVDAIRQAGGHASRFAVDLTDEADVLATVDRVLAEYGPIDVVGNSVGGGGITGIFETSLEDYQRAFDVNLGTALLLMRAVQPHMSSGGAIVHVSSGAVEGRGPGLPYTLAKTALEKLCVGAAATLAPRGIRVNCIRVGMIWGAFAARGMTQERRELRAGSVALRTEGNVWDIASAAHFLCTPAARWVTGQVLPVDGGGTVAPSAGQAGSTTS
ncbi:SDR family NAD(P)-dependent oxidoreductase [Citricoccus sp. K5]|uniref:SDR family NAD(P)-dependent oxidoreductase n=1 Tax=Citricoccus sp. K5 TaxID=2653135 RepID=UPI0012F38EB5|nr:SDR family oxidoreductase [Citricoccus sp. K5]VXB05804.1 NAD(P)-dependent dehydrogenase (Short-subunit alcohol dehydrogenase family) [Citricoccus sp. K5]